jgi:hypothetical protein
VSTREAIEAVAIAHAEPIEAERMGALDHLIGM